jgi:lipoyl(octanoyl) transferase
MNIEIKKEYKLKDYEESLNFMQLRVNEIYNNSKDELIWFLNHDHIYTLGTSSSNKEILKRNNIKVFQSNRGGKTTYHGPGQRIIYFMINLNNRKKDIRKFITIIEESLIDLLKIYKVESTTFKDRVGIWVTGNNGKLLKKEKKIGAIGLRLKNWVTYHGLSFNINPEMGYYDYINACGLENYKNTSLEELGIRISKEEFDIKYLSFFLKNLNNLK